jgi:hypothetical protein
MTIHLREGNYHFEFEKNHLAYTPMRGKYKEFHAPGPGQNIP